MTIIMLLDRALKRLRPDRAAHHGGRHREPRTTMLVLTDALRGEMHVAALAGKVARDELALGGDDLAEELRVLLPEETVAERRARFERVLEPARALELAKADAASGGGPLGRQLFQRRIVAAASAFFAGSSWNVAR